MAASFYVGGLGWLSSVTEWEDVPCERLACMRILQRLFILQACKEGER